MNVREPSIDELRRIAGHYQMRLSEADLASYKELMSEGIASYRRVP